MSGASGRASLFSTSVSPYQTASESLANSVSLSSEKTNKASMSPLLGAPLELPLRTSVFTFLGSYNWCLEAITQWLLP